MARMRTEIRDLLRLGVTIRPFPTGPTYRDPLFKTNGNIQPRLSGN